MGTLDAWLESRCDRGQFKTALAAALYEDWLGFTQPDSGWPHSIKAFGQAMTEYGFAKVRRAEGIRYIGVALRDPLEEFKARVAEVVASDRLKDGEI